ncbi:MAG: hydantoinase B/oxoprolinase family protein [Pseudomonadota bacterium]
MAVDQITTEIIRNAFVSIAQDMNATLIRSAFTPVIYEGKDCSVALIDADGEVLGQSLGLPLFLGNLEICVKLIAEQHGWDYFQEGDIFYMNDSYMTGTHLNDATVIMPIFWQGTRVGFAASRAHWLDVGAMSPGTPVNSYEIYQEGVRWGPTRMYERGVPRLDVIDLLRRNSRFGESTVGDFNAQVAAAKTGEQRLQALFDRFGAETIDARLKKSKLPISWLESRARGF